MGANVVIQISGILPEQRRGANTGEVIYQILNTSIVSRKRYVPQLGKIAMRPTCLQNALHAFANNRLISVFCNIT